MPRHSPYRIKLTDDQRRVLESRSRQYTLPYWQVVRAQMVLMAAQGLRNDEIAAQSFLAAAGTFRATSFGLQRSSAGRCLQPLERFCS